MRVVRFEQAAATVASGRPPHMRILACPDSVAVRWQGDDSWLWTGGRVEGSGVAQYTYRVRIRPPGAAGWREVASGRTAATGVTLTDLPLLQGSQCSLSLLAHDRAGNPSEWLGATFTVAFTDTTPPPAPVPRVAATTAGTVRIAWDAVHDPESGVYGYAFGIGTAPDRADVLPWVDKGRATEHLLRGLTLRARSGVSYYLLVRVTNGAGLVDAASRLIELADRMGLADETLCQAHERMEGFKHLVTEDEAAFVAALEDVTTRLALGLRKDGPRSG